MEEIKQSITCLVEQVAVLTEELKKQKEKVTILEDRRGETVVEVVSPPNRAINEYDLMQIATLPDCVKEIEIFSGEACMFSAWIRRADIIIQDYQVVRDKPMYRAVFLHLRSKIRGEADEMLYICNVPNDSWEEIRAALASHYEELWNTK